MTEGVSQVSLEIGGTTIEFETGKLAKQASGSVVVTAGETKVLCTATAGNLRDVDFLPLTVDVEERMYAAGKIPGSFFRREGRAGEKWLLESPLDLVVAGTEEAILMVEAGADEIAEAEVLDALDIAHAAIKELCQAQHDLRKQAGKEKLDSTPLQVDDAVLSELKDRFGAALDAATQVVDKLERQEATKRVEEEALEALSGDPEAEDHAERRAAAQLAFDTLEKDIIRRRIAVDKKRPDGRAAEEIRDIWIEVGIAPRAHGSAIFTRGQTQAFSVAALGTTREEMRLDTRGLLGAKHSSPPYTFPPFSVGEAGFMRGPKRRDIGHGALAERALVPVVPSL